MQENLTIGEITIPVWREENELWYPLSTIYKDFYGRYGLTKQGRAKYKEYCRLFKIKYVYGEEYSVINETWCINEDGLKLWIDSIHPKRLTKLEQKKNHNMLCIYLGKETISELNDYIEIIDLNYINENYNDYELKLYNSVSDYNEYCLCNECKIYYPVHELFYLKNPQNTKGFDTSKCIKCKTGNFKGKKKSDKIKHIENNHKSEIDKIKTVVKKYDSIPKEWYSKENILLLFNELKDNHVVNLDDFSRNKFEYICELFKINKYTVLSFINYFDLTLELFGIYFYTKPYKHKDRSLPRKLQNFDFQVKVFNNYLEDNNIIIQDDLNFKYMDIINKSCVHIGNYYKNGAIDCLDFVYRYNNNKYPAYKYKISSTNYWKIKDNRITALKDLVIDLKLSNINKLPIYLTKYTLKNISNTMYNVYRKYYNNLFDWVDECYPNTFEFSDFNTNIQRNEFDSLEEMQIHEILKDKFGKDLIYNIGNGSNRFSVVDKYQPDWILLRYKPVIIEYFGMYSDNYTDKSTLVKYYNEKMPVKIEHYETLENYDKLYIYPYDLKNNFEGLYKKLEDYI